MLSIVPIVYAQTLQEVRVARLLAIDTYDKLSNISMEIHNVGKNYYLYDDFIQLFIDTARIYNDLLPDNSNQYVSPFQYLSIYENKIATDKIDFQAFELNEMVKKQEDGFYTIKCRFTKSVKYITYKGYHYPQCSFRYSMTLVIDQNMEHALISEIIPDYPICDFYILSKHPNHDILFHRIPIDEYDENNLKLFVADQYDLDSFSITNSDFFQRAEFIRDTIDPHFYRLEEPKIDMASFSLGVGLYTIGNRVSNKILPSMDLYAQQNYPMQLCGKYSRQFPRMNPLQKSIWFMNIGASIDWTKYKISANYSRIIDAIDEDGEAYSRSIYVKLKKENIDKVDFTIPITFEALFPINTKKSVQQFISLELGVWGSVTLFNHIQYDAETSYKGTYNYFDGVTFEKYYDYGDFKLNEQTCKPEYYSNRFNFGGIASLSYLIHIKEFNMLKFGVQYKQGYMSPAQLPEDFVLSYNKNHYQSFISAFNGWQGDLFFQISYIYLIQRKKTN